MVPWGGVGMKYEWDGSEFIILFFLWYPPIWSQWHPKVRSGHKAVDTLWSFRRRILVLAWGGGQGSPNTQSSNNMPIFVCFLFSFLLFFLNHHSVVCQPHKQPSNEGNINSNGGPVGPQLRRKKIFPSDQGSYDPRKVGQASVAFNLSVCLFSCLWGSDVDIATKEHSREGPSNSQIIGQRTKEESET